MAFAADIWSGPVIAKRTILLPSANRHLVDESVQAGRLTVWITTKLPA
jgi:hypothetical protein